MSVRTQDHAPHDGAGACLLSTAEALRRLAVRRDSEAWSAILHNHGVAILRLAQRLTGDKSLCDDVCQETLLQIRTHAGRFRPPERAQEVEAAARGWVMCIAYRTAVGMLRVSVRRSQNEAQARREQAAQSNTELDSLLTSEQLAWVRNEIAGLPDLLRSAVCLHFYGEMSYPELSAALECSEKAARKRVERGVQQLRTRLSRGGLALGVGALAAALIGQTQMSSAGALGAASAAGVSNALTLGQLAAWQALLNNPATPLLAGVAKVGGVAIMTKYVVGVAAVLAFGLSTVQAVRLHSMGAEANEKAAAMKALQERIDTLENQLSQTRGDTAALKSSVQSRNNELAAIEKKVNTLEQQSPSSGGVATFTMPAMDGVGGGGMMQWKAVAGAGMPGQPATVIAADPNAPYDEVVKAIRQRYPKAPAPDKDTVVKVLGDGTIQYQSADGRVMQQFKDTRILKLPKDVPAAPPPATQADPKAKGPIGAANAAPNTGDVLYVWKDTGNAAIAPAPIVPPGATNGTTTNAPGATTPPALHSYGASAVQTVKELIFGGDAMLKPPAAAPITGAAPAAPAPAFTPPMRVAPPPVIATPQALPGAPSNQPVKPPKAPEEF